MCQSKADGGKRCTGTLYGKAAYAMYRERKADPARAADITARLQSLKKARDKYGTFVSPMSMDLPDGVPAALDVARRVGNPLIVGGAVRDVYFGAASKDTDIEVYGTTIEKLTDTFRMNGFNVDEVGKEFGVLKVSKKGVVSDLDVAIPRRENLTGRGHTDFEVETDSGMTVEDAASRRDFTINAMSYDPELGVLIDPYNGTEDSENGVLSAVSDKFGEDPLRVLRGVQFAARFGMKLDAKTASICKNLRPHYAELSVERVQEEWAKLYSKGINPDAGIRALQETEWDDTVPGLRESLANEKVVDSLKNIPNIPKDDRAVCGAAAIMRGMADENRAGFGRTTLIGKDAQRLALDFVHTDPTSLNTDYALKMYAKDKASRGFTFEKYRAYAEMVGHRDGVVVANAAIAAGVGETAEPPLVQGRDIIPLSSKKPGPWVGELVAAALDKQYRGEFVTKDAAVKWAKSQFESAP